MSKKPERQRRAALDAAEKARIEELRGRSWTIKAIAAEVKCSQGSVSWHLLQVGAPRKGPLGQSGKPRKAPAEYFRNGVRCRTFTPEEDARITKMRIDGMTPFAIAREIGRPHNSVVGRLATIARHEEERCP